MQFQDATQAMTVAIRAIFNRWTALSLTITHHLNGATYLMDDMLHETVAMATHPSKRFDQDAYINLFYAIFDKMHVDIQDGSPEQVAQHIVRVRDAAAVGNFGPASDAAQKAGISMQSISRSLSGGDVPAHSASGNAREPMDTLGDADMTETPNAPKVKPPPVIDDDGFQEVVHRRRRR